MTNRSAAANRADPTAQGRVIDATEPVERLLRDLRTSRRGLSSREVERRLIVYGPNELRRRGGNRRWRELARQSTHPLALQLWAAAGLAWLAGTVPVAIAIVVIIVLNAVFAFFQEVDWHMTKISSARSWVAAKGLTRGVGPASNVQQDGREPANPDSQCACLRRHLAASMALTSQTEGPV